MTMMISGQQMLDPMAAIHSQTWYHGMRSRNETFSYFKNEGDFLVRTTTIFGKRFEFVISVCTVSKKDAPNEVQHLALYYDRKNNAWSLRCLKKAGKSGASIKSGSQMDRFSTKFTSVTDLVKHYQQVPIYKTVLLKNAIPRPKWIIPTSFIKYEQPTEILGKGNFAKVVKAKMAKPNNKEIRMFVAVKILLESETDGTTEQERDEGRDSMMREAKVMQRYSHKNVLKFFGVACDKPPISLVLEFCPGGSLEGHLKKAGDGISAAERVQYILESARGLRYLHHHNCIHRDLATRNCLISAEGVVKIADFGLSKVLDKNDIGDDEDNIKQNVPLRWMAPETISKEPRFSRKSDVWSFGVMCFEIFNNGIKPWADIDQCKVISRAIRSGNMPSPPSKTPSSIVNLMKDCWKIQIGDRPEFYEIVRRVCLIQEKEAEMKPLNSSEYTVNTTPGVNRIEKTESAEEMLAQKSVELLNSLRESSNRMSDESKDSKDSTLTKSKESKSKESKSKESAEDHTSAAAKRKKTANLLAKKKFPILSKNKC